MQFSDHKALQVSLKTLLTTIGHIALAMDDSMLDLVTKAMSRLQDQIASPSTPAVLIYQRVKYTREMLANLAMTHNSAEIYYIHNRFEEILQLADILLNSSGPSAVAEQ